MRAVKRFLAWAEGQGVELPAITPGMVGHYLVGLSGSTSNGNLHLSALRGFFDRLVNRHVVILNPASSVKGTKETVMEGKTPEITVDQAQSLLRSVDTTSLIGLRDRVYRTGNGRSGKLTEKAMDSRVVCDLVKRRLKDAGLPSRLSPHSFRVAAITDLLTQGVPLEDVQYLAGHAAPRTTGLYDRSQKRVTRNIVERISI